MAEKFFSLRDFENIILNHNGKKLFYGAVIVTVVIAVTLLAGKFVPSIQEGGIIVKFSAGAFATAAECGDKSYMTNTADYIIQGIVEKVRGKCICKENTTQILTYTDMKIEKYIKGTPLKTNKLQIITPGGCCVIEEEDCYGNIGEEICAGVEDAPILHEGKRVILYLRKVPKEFREFGEEFSIVCGNLGVEEISEECQDECSPEGVRECVAMISPEGETTGYRICGNYDGDSCLEWSKVFPCPEGTTCVNGKCESISEKGNTTSSPSPKITTVSIVTSAKKVSPGALFRVDVVVDPKVAIAGVQFDLEFDPSLVGVVSVREGDLLKQNGASTYFMPGTINNAKGTITGVAGAITTPGASVSSPGTFAIIEMRAKSSGTSPLHLSNVIVGDIDGNPVPVEVKDGSITITHSH